MLTNILGLFQKFSEFIWEAQMLCYCSASSRCLIIFQVHWKENMVSESWKIFTNVHVQTTSFVLKKNGKGMTPCSCPKRAQQPLSMFTLNKKGENLTLPRWCWKGHEWVDPPLFASKMEEMGPYPPLLLSECPLPHLHWKQQKTFFQNFSEFIWEAQMLRYRSTSLRSFLWESVLNFFQNGRGRSQKDKASTLHHNHLCYWSAI